MSKVRGQATYAWKCSLHYLQGHIDVYQVDQMDKSKMTEWYKPRMSSLNHRTVKM